MLNAKLLERSHVDFVQAILCTFIRVHQERITACEGVDADEENQENIVVPLTASDLTKTIEDLYKSLTESSEKLEQLYVESLPVLKWIKSALI